MNNIILSPIEKNELINEIADAVIYKLQNVETKSGEPDELLQTHQVMKLLGRSRTTIKNWRDLGLLKHQVINSRVYFKRSDIMNSGLHLSSKRKK
ncbi:helix-turn-helix domain-containing protein [Mucilaginibacter sp.]